MRAFAGRVATSFILCATSVYVCSWAADASDLLGAHDVIARIQSAEEQGLATNKPPEVTPQTLFYADLAQFTSNSAALPPEAAATRWLAFFDRYWTLPSGMDGDRMRGMHAYIRTATRPQDIKDVLAAVPNPATWEAMLKIVDARPTATEHADRELLLRMYVLYLNGKFDRALDEIKRTTDVLAKKSPDRVDQLRYTVRSLRCSLRELSGDRLPGGMITAFERQLDEITDPGSQNVEITIPDLLAFSDTNQATRLIEKAIRLPNAALDVKGSDNTRALVRCVVLKHLSEIRMPPWHLVGGDDTIEFYEALTNKYPLKSAEADLNAEENSNSMVRRTNDDDWRMRNGRDQATAAYLWALVACGRLDEAINLVTGAGAASLRELNYESRHDRLGLNNVAPRQFFDFLAKLLEKKPDTPAWSAFAAAALSVDRTNDALASVRAFQKTTAGKIQPRIQSDIANAFLTLDAVDEAAAALRQSARIERVGVSAEVFTRQSYDAQSAATRLTQLGKLLDRADWINEGIDLMRSFDTQVATRGWNRYGCDQSFARVLAENKRYEEAEQVLLHHMTEQKRLLIGKGSIRGYDSEGQNAMSPDLQDLLKLYSEAGRPTDIVALLRDAPWWGAADLQTINAHRYNSSDDVDLLVNVAEALLTTSQTNAAATVAHEAVRRAPGYDPGYQVLMKIDAPGLPAWLDDRYARDKFEERPLIWKASLLLKQGRLEDAEQTIRLALKVDPTDGETRPGDRVRAYAVLADVLDARGKKDDAAFFRHVVESVRVAEKGDEFKNAGLVQRSLPLYEKASRLFANAYCVQWRMAERLWALGKRDEAEQHYVIAFERMPEQFGQIAHLCFGCEGVFDKPESRGVAERVLMRLAQNGPPRAQVHFLIGELREKQGRYFEAYKEFRKSVAIDPGYMDGWTRLNEIANETAVSQADRDEIALAMLRLDPLCKHANVELGQVADLRTLWVILEKSRSVYEAPPVSILPLPASERDLEDAKKHQTGEPHNMDVVDYEQTCERFGGNPGEVIAANQIVQRMLELQREVEQLGTSEE